MRSFLALLIVAAGCSGPAASPDMAASGDLSALPGDAATGSCKDGIKNGQETDVDCGGPICPACADGKACGGGMDCQSGGCFNNVCVGGGGDMAMDRDMAMSVGDMTAATGDDMVMAAPGDMAMAPPPDMAMVMPIACMFDDPNSLLDDCVVGP